MDKYYFSSVVTSSGILSAEEVSLLQKYFDKTLDGPVGFPEHPRLPQHLVRRQRFRYCGGSWAYNRGQKESLYSAARDGPCFKNPSFTNPVQSMFYKSSPTNPVQSMFYKSSPTNPVQSMFYKPSPCFTNQLQSMFYNMPLKNRRWF